MPEQAAPGNPNIKLGFIYFYFFAKRDVPFVVSIHDKEMYAQNIFFNVLDHLTWMSKVAEQSKKKQKNNTNGAGHKTVDPLEQ